MSRDAGGIFEVECALAKELTSRGCEISVFSPSDAQSICDLACWAPVEPQIFPCFGNDSFRYSPGLRRAFINGSQDLCHLHSLWSHTSLVASHWSVISKKPLLVSPNGMLDPWALRNSKWKKMLIGWLIEKRMLSRSSCVQANTTKDVEDYQRYGFRGPIAVIPNGVYLPNKVCVPRATSRSMTSAPKRIVYLGRIHRKKGLANLVHAWGQIQQEKSSREWQLVIAGKDDGGHLPELRQLCIDYGLRCADSKDDKQSDVTFLGPTYADEKYQLLTEASLFVLPSFSEGLPMAVLEAWAHRAPVMMTAECNLNIGFEMGAAIEVRPSIQSIRKGLLSAFDRSSDELSDMGECGYELVKSNFVWSSVARQMHELYAWMIGGGNEPQFVTK
ncbi:glycosyltransferase [Rhodopirellula bahusiensis]|uniref:Glycosyltransferase subfamily 4-like N-terminal domain-containing protein n=1 Tax=Rhodopirellula bahusiensis TaxID=2014065 RepID=A0A2G1WCG6_9BACT|nr:glycosyltransferase [Rhodopirellula bahusiensis]PHQ36734.1 hypothetical protein CEE69_05185 [Rhodopirellula bahusiensis]